MSEVVKSPLKFDVVTSFDTPRAFRKAAIGLEAEAVGHLRSSWRLYSSFARQAKTTESRLYWRAEKHNYARFWISSIRAIRAMIDR